MNHIFKGATLPFLAAFILLMSASGAHADAGLGVTQITSVRTSAIADNTFDNGWKWIFDVTVPTSETLLQMKFADWVSGSATLPVAGNMRFYSTQSTDAMDADHAATISASDIYDQVIHLDTTQDLSTASAGRQIQIAVETRVPVGTVNGSFGTSYGINTEVDSSAPVDDPEPSAPVTVDGNSTSSSESYNSTTPTNSTGTFTLKFDVTAGDDDIYIPKSVQAISSTTAPSSTTGVVVITDLAGSTTSATAVASSLTSTANVSGSFYVVHAGETKTFTTNVTIDPSVSGYYQVGLDRIRVAIGSATTSLVTLDIDETDSDFQSDQQFIH